MRFLAYLLAFPLALSLSAADGTPLRTNTPVTVSSTQAESFTAQLTARIMQNSHYLHLPFNDELSAKFFDRYLSALDPQRLFFLETDIAEFEPFRLTLDDRILRSGDTKAGNIIYLRFFERFKQHTDYVQELLKTEKFSFETDERYTPDRRKMSRPKNMEEAKKLWRDRLRYEYLQAKLDMEKPEVLVKIVTDKLKEKKADEVARALEEKMSKEKAAEIGKLAVEKAATMKTEEIGKLVLARLESDKDQEIVNNLKRRHERLFRLFTEYDNDRVFELFLTSFTHIYDPHSDYFGKPTADNFAINMKLSLFGIGAVLRSEDGYCKIQELMSGGPAGKSGKIKPNDRIVAVGQTNQAPVDVVDMPLNKVVEMIRGPKDTEVRLTIIPADAPDPSVRKMVTLIRDEIKLEDQEAKAKIIDIPDTGGKKLRLGVIDLPSFYADMDSRKEGHKSTTTDVAKLLAKLKEEKVEGVVIDLRRNGGGSLEEAINLTGLFIKDGPVVMVKDSNGGIEIDADRDPAVLYDGPLMVLTSRGSASASEILAAALQDYGRAVIVGDSSTHGKGTVQSLAGLKGYLENYGVKLTNDPGTLKLTIRKFYRPNGESTQLKGVVPDIILPSVNNVAEVGEASLDNPLEWDKVPPSKFDAVNLIQPVLPELKKRSDARVSASKDYSYVRDDMERFKKAQADKSVSLNEAQRIKEKKEASDRVEERRKDIRARGASKEAVYDLSLKLAAQPGLPPATVPTNTVAKASVPKGDDLDEEDSLPDPSLQYDVTMEEAKRILKDLIQLAKKDGLAKTQPK